VKGMAIRFFVEDNVGRRSSTWRVWTNGKTSDVYFGHREAAGEVKGSLHPSGLWHYGLTRERLRTAHDIRGWQGPSRHLMSWQRPPEKWPGLTLAVEFAFPTNELQVVPFLKRDGCTVIPAAPPGQAVVVVLFLGKPGARLDGRWPGEKDMGSALLSELSLPCGDRVFLVHSVYTPPPISLQDLDELRREFAFMRDTANRRARCCSIVINDDGSRLFVEGAVHPERVVVMP
jgi:hypothetical protein